MGTRKEFELTHISGQKVSEVVGVEQSDGHLLLKLVVNLNSLVQSQQLFTRERYEKKKKGVWCMKLNTPCLNRMSYT